MNGDCMPPVAMASTAPARDTRVFTPQGYVETAGSLPDAVRRKIWVAAEDLANTIGCTLVEGKPRGYGEPDLRDAEIQQLRYDLGQSQEDVRRCGREIERLQRDLLAETDELGTANAMLEDVREALGPVHDDPRMGRTPADCVTRLREELDRVSGGWQARVESRQKLVQERDEAREEWERSDAHATRLFDELREIREKLAVHLNRKPSENGGVPTIDLVDDMAGRWRTAVTQLRSTEADLTEARATIGRVCSDRHRVLAERDAMAPALVQIQTVLKAVDDTLAAQQPAKAVAGDA